MEKRMISTELVEEDVKIENNLRPLSLEDYIGQEKVKRNLKVYIEAAKERGDSLDHVLFYGNHRISARLLEKKSLAIALNWHFLFAIS